LYLFSNLCFHIVIVISKQRCHHQVMIERDDVMFAVQLYLFSNLCFHIVIVRSKQRWHCSQNLYAQLQILACMHMLQILPCLHIHIYICMYLRMLICSCVCMRYICVVIPESNELDDCIENTFYKRTHSIREHIL